MGQLFVGFESRRFERNEQQLQADRFVSAELKGKGRRKFGKHCDKVLIDCDKPLIDCDKALIEDYETLIEDHETLIEDYETLIEDDKQSISAARNSVRSGVRPSSRRQKFCANE